MLNNNVMDLRSLKKELAETYIKLGQKVYDEMRVSECPKMEWQEIIKYISTIEKKIYENSKAKVPKFKERKCPDCLTSFTSETVFCSKCGCNIKAFYEKGSKKCNNCESVTNENDNFCGICGTKLDLEKQEI